MKTKIVALLLTSSGALVFIPPSCHPPAPVDAGSDAAPSPTITPTGAIDAGGQAVGGICYFLQGLDPSGAIANVCATIEELLSAASFIAMLRTTPNVLDAGTCENLPQTTYCVTSAERYKAVRYITTRRASRLLLIDAGK